MSYAEEKQLHIEMLWIHILVSHMCVCVRVQVCVCVFVCISTAIYGISWLCAFAHATFARYLQRFMSVVMFTQNKDDKAGAPLGAPAFSIHGCANISLVTKRCT